MFAHYNGGSESLVIFPLDFLGLKALDTIGSNSKYLLAEQLYT